MGLLEWSSLLGNIGEFVGALAVLVTLVYLAIQIRENTTESRLVASSAITREYNEWLRHITGDANLSDLWLRAIENFETLTDTERGRIIMLTGSFMRIVEDAYGQHESGRMSPANWHAYERLLVRATQASFFHPYWALRKDMHADGFAAWVEQQVSSIQSDPRGLFE